MSNRGELSSRTFAAVDSPNVSSEAQAIIDKYLVTERFSWQGQEKDIQIVTVYRSQPVIGVMKGL